MLKSKSFTHSNLRKNTVLKHIAVGVASFASALGRIMGFPSPVCVVIAVLSGENVIAAFLGALLGYMLFGGVETGMIQLCSILVIAGVRFTLLRSTQKDDSVFLSILASGVMLLFSCVVSLAVPADVYTTSMRMALSLMCGCLVFAARSIIMQRSSEGAFRLHGISGVLMSMLYIMLISTLTAIPVPLFNVGRIIGVFVILAAVRKYKTAGGAVVGALTTCGVLLCEPSLARNTLMFATSGLICGAFVQFGMLVAIPVFIGSSIISLIAIGVNADTFSMFADLLAASAIFVLCPDSVLKKLASCIITAHDPADYIGQSASSKLNFASKTLGDIRSQIALVSAAIDRKSASADIKVNTCTDVCSACEMFQLCWKRSSLTAKKAFNSFEDTLMKYNCLSEYDVKTALPACCRQKQLTDVFNRSYDTYLSDKADNIRIREMQQLVAEQLSSMEDILSDLSYRVSCVRNIDSQLSTQVRDYFSQLGYPNAKSCVYIDENSCQRVEVYLTADFKGDLVKITIGVSGITECELDIPAVDKIDNVTRLTFSELPAFETDISVFQASSSDNGYSGDTLEVIESSSSEKYVLLSDGMGTGKRARLDSMFAVDLARRLLKAGISMTSIHRLINSILRVKGWDESFATLDLLKLDLCGGSGEFLKAGAAPAYLVRGGVVKAIGGQAFPVGILGNCQPDVTSCKLFAGDMLILASDGADENVLRNVTSVMRKGALTANEISQALGEQAMRAYSSSRRDDISIAVIRVLSR